MEERDFLVRLRSIERRAILPLKWALFAVSLAFWFLSHPNHRPPPVEVFALFTVYFMFTLGEMYFLLLSSVTLSQTRILCIVSYLVDVLFVTLLIYFDAQRFPSPDFSSDFYVFYFLLILRGFALFRTARANLAANALIGAIFILSLVWQDSELTGYPTRGNLVRVVFIWLVITMSWFIVEVINRQKEEISRTRERLVQSENMAILGELAAGVAHEINNPIGIISAYAEFLIRNAPPGDPRVEDFRAIHKEARRCERIVAQLLDYAKPGASEIVPTDLAALNDEVLGFIFRPGRDTAPSIIIEKNYAKDLPAVQLNADQMKQALLNVYLNAQQSMQEGGRLVTTLQYDAETNQVRLQVQDSGPGISADNLKRVFDPFFTTRARGTGLGLSIARRMVESYGGTIELRSEKEKGTTVDIILPLEGGPA